MMLVLRRSQGNLVVVRPGSGLAPADADRGWTIDCSDLLVVMVAVMFPHCRSAFRRNFAAEDVSSFSVSGFHVGMICILLCPS
jgi:hypothetical protein